MGKKLLKLLIVDDEIGIRKGLTHFINWEKEGYVIIGDVPNGEEALKKIRSIKPDIIISDIVMPEMGGIALMKAIQKLYPEIGVIILSSYDDFKYVKTVMQYGADDYLLKASLTPNELLSMLNKVVSKRGMLKKETSDLKITNNFSRYLSGFSSDEEKDNLDKQLKDIPGYLVMTNLSKFSDIEQEKNDLYEIFQTSLATEQVSLASVGGQITLLIQSPKKNEELIDLLEKTTEILVVKYPYLFFIYSQSITTSQDLKITYEKINNSLHQERFVNKEQQIVSIHQLTHVDELSNFDMKRYLLALTNRQFFQALDYLDQYFKENTDKNIEENSLRNLTTSTIYNYLSSLEETYGESEQLTELKLNIFSTLNDISYLDDFKGIFDDVCHQLSLFTDSVATSYHAQLAQSLEQYIRDHSSEKISMKELAQEFHFSYSYLSSYFSTTMNESFNDFLNRIRIDKASYLLKKSILTISEISQEVGYSDVSYFSKVFKKTKGQTPIKYRRRAIK